MKTNYSGMKPIEKKENRTKIKGKIRAFNGREVEGAEFLRLKNGLS